VDLLLEIGTEELPASAVYDAISQIEHLLPLLLERARLDVGELRVLGSPRRLAAMVRGVPDSAAGRVVKKKGPPLSAAKGGDGSWTQAAAGFARSQGIEPDELVIEEAGKGSYVFAVSETAGLPASDLLPGVLSELVGSLRFKKSMRWGARDERFSRPVRWLLAVADGEVVPLEYGGLTATNLTRGHRYLSSGEVAIEGPSHYESALEKKKVVADHRRRREEIVAAAEGACAASGTQPLLDGQVLEEVVQLVEWPGVVLGRFDERFLALPAEVLVHAMEEHQRYFPVTDGEGSLQAAFIAVHNGDPRFADVITRGHQRVLAARLSDAEFFYNEDRKRPLADRRRELDHVTYQSELGNMAEKSARLTALVNQLGGGLGMPPEVIERARRAASLAKCDLVTHVVVEFPALQGVIGSIYALEDGEDERVAGAIAEQYLPRRLGDDIPSTLEGSLLSLAEKADNLAASFGLGHVPTGSEDPYALRRQALGMLLVMTERDLLFSVMDSVRAAAAELDAEAHGFTWKREAETAFADFFRSRERVFYADRGYRYDLVEAVLSVDWERPLAALQRLKALEGAREQGLLARLYTAFERCHNLSRGRETAEVSEALFSEPVESELLDALKEAELEVAAALERQDFDAAVRGMEPICEPVDRLFDGVLIMAEDGRLRTNRLSLLARIDALFSSVADFTKLTWD
jgi:glycyl-tRNA synthetase beta chain